MGTEVFPLQPTWSLYVKDPGGVALVLPTVVIINESIKSIKYMDCTFNGNPMLKKTMAFQLSDNGDVCVAAGAE